METRLTIEEIEEYARVMEKEFDDEAFSVRLALQLADTMRENERLRNALGKIINAECPYVMFNIAKESLSPNKDSDNG